MPAKIGTDPDISVLRKQVWPKRDLVKNEKRKKMDVRIVLYFTACKNL